MKNFAIASLVMATISLGSYAVCPGSNTVANVVREAKEYKRSVVGMGFEDVNVRWLVSFYELPTGGAAGTTIIQEPVERGNACYYDVGQPRGLGGAMALGRIIIVKMMP